MFLWETEIVGQATSFSDRYRHPQDTKTAFPFSSDLLPVDLVSVDVSIAGNEIADSLARAGASESTTPAAPLTYLELF
ncbi:hypothetical protein TNCV_909611 [Trichonephila clavipes]|nr:hypothetical protein TNCV_909611 [Trichonephila clavipes]